MKRNAGFTLIELVIVIIVLGILAATAVPKFINLQDDARESAMKGVEAAVHSAANIVYSKSAIDGNEGLDAGETNSNVGNIQTAFGYPTAAANGIVEAIEISGFITVSGATNTLFVAEGTPAENDFCVEYVAATSSSQAYSTVFGQLASATAIVCTKQ